MIRILAAASTGLLLFGAAAGAQDLPQPPIAFEGGSLTITETADLDKILAFDGQEIARNYVVFFDRMVELGETRIALFAVGDGGNQCGPATVIVWKPEGEGILSDTVGEDCGAPPAAATTDSLYFVPYLIPGDSRPVEVWTPQGGLKVAGSLSFVPQPGTGWNDLDPAKLDNIVDAFDNEAVYASAKKLLGRDMVDFVTGLLTGGGTEKTGSGAFYASGCVPHACGSADAFMAVDPRVRKLYLAQQSDQGRPRAWPALKEWPKDIAAAMRQSLNTPQ